MNIELESLCGEHQLSGAFFDAINEHGEEQQVLRFTLDGKHHEAIEDPSDGYRSCLQEIRTTDVAPANVFPSTKVIAGLKTQGEYGTVDCILQFLNAATGKIIIEIGTDNTDDYYPGFVALFSPENL